MFYISASTNTFLLHAHGITFIRVGFMATLYLRSSTLQFDTTMVSQVINPWPTHNNLFIDARTCMHGPTWQVNK